MDFNEISRSLSSLLLLWSAIESAARGEVAHFNGGVVPKSAYGIAAVLNAWEEAAIAQHGATGLGASAAKAIRCRLHEYLKIRNGVCHGLEGIASSEQGKPAMLTWRSNGQAHSITWIELQECFGWLSRAPRAIAILGRPCLREVGGRFADNPENREWWETEFDIDLTAVSYQSPFPELEKGGSRATP